MCASENPQCPATLFADCAGVGGSLLRLDAKTKSLGCVFVDVATTTRGQLPRRCDVGVIVHHEPLSAPYLRAATRPGRRDSGPRPVGVGARAARTPHPTYSNGDVTPMALGSLTHEKNRLKGSDHVTIVWTRPAHTSIADASQSRDDDRKSNLYQAPLALPRRARSRGCSSRHAGTHSPTWRALSMQPLMPQHS